MNEELITIIIPVYNIEAYLPRCLETVAAQTYRNLEIILVDDGSTDTSGAICDDFADKDCRALVIHQHNSGLWAARNAGQKIARGQYLMFVDGDDYIHLDAIRTMWEALQNSSYDLAIISEKKVQSLYEDIESPGENIKIVLDQKQLFEKTVTGNFTLGVVWNKLYRKGLIDNIWARNYARAQDMDYNLRVYMNTTQAIWIQRALYYWVQRPGSLTKTPDFLFQYQTCRVNIIYQNLVELPKDGKHYQVVLLKKLYRILVFLKHSRWSSNNSIVLCKTIEKATKRDYWLCWRINPLEKIGITILLFSPRLTRWLMRVTKNY